MTLRLFPRPQELYLKYKVSVWQRTGDKNKIEEFMKNYKTKSSRHLYYEYLYFLIFPSSCLCKSSSSRKIQQPSLPKIEFNSLRILFF